MKNEKELNDLKEVIEKLAKLKKENPRKFKLCKNFLYGLIDEK